MAWIVAGSLNRLLDQLNAYAPRRSKASDGSIGDVAHQKAGTSDHLPHVVLDGQAYVTARDFTHDPAGGLDCSRLASTLQLARDSRVKYVIWNRRIMSGAAGPSPWVWRDYTGTNAHTRHLHLSVVADNRCRDASPWTLPGLIEPVSGEYCRMRDRNDRVLNLQNFMTVTFPAYNAYRPTGYFGLATAEGLKEFQRRVGITGPDADGTVCGPRTMVQLKRFGFTP